MYKIIQNISSYTHSPALLGSLIAGILMSVAVFNLLIVPIHNRVKYFLIRSFGDSTPFEQGVVSMSPRDNIHIVGFFSSLFLNIGFAAPAYYDDENFRHPKIYTVIISLSGIFTYFVFFGISYFVYALLRLYNLFDISSINLTTLDTGFFGCIYYAFFIMTYYLAITCIYSAIFNVLPVYPLDMGDTLYLCAPVNWTDALRNNELMVSLGLFILCFLVLGTSDGLIYTISLPIRRTYMNLISSLLGVPAG